VIRGIAALAAAWLLGMGAGSAAGAAPPVADPSDAERCEGLLRSFDDAFLAASEGALDEATLVEAEEIAAIAEELLAEEEAAIAVTLLEEAVRLLGASSEP
jgi:hypothetical protein